MAGEIEGLFDSQMTRMVLESREGLATGLRIVGLSMIALAIGPTLCAGPPALARVIPLVGALLATSS